MTRRETEIEQMLLRRKATCLETTAAALHAGAAAARAAAALKGLNLAMREAQDAQEAELLFAHPDLMELDLADAAWNPEAS